MPASIESRDTIQIEDSRIHLASLLKKIKSVVSASSVRHTYLEAELAMIEGS